MISDESVSFVVGFIAAVLAIGWFAACVDYNFKYTDKKLRKIEIICEKFNSTPESFDTRDVTCDNGIVVNYMQGDM